LKESNLDLDEAQRQRSLKELRRSNASVIVKEIVSRVESKHPTLCDVGTAYGWFLESAQAAGIESLGIEPEVAVAKSAIQNGLAVRVGEFPSCLTSTEQFDVLTFNDVFEHLANPVQVLESCRTHLRPRGLLVLVLPSSHGFLFRLARVLRGLGIRKPWDRLWQRSFPCPHAHYYSPSGLNTLLVTQGFQLEYAADLPSFHYHGLWNRIRMESNVSLTRAWMSYVLLIGLSPILRFARSDISLQIYRVVG
jgi:SAM-dependent methyltransferase